MTISTKLMITAFPFVVFGLTVLTFLWPMKARVRTKARWAMVLLLCASRGVVYRAFGGEEQAPSLPEALLWAWDWACVGFYLLAALSLVWWTRRGRRILLPLVAWGVAAVGFFNALKPPVVKEVEVAYPNLPTGLDGYRIAHLSDLHCCPSLRGWRTRAIVDSVNALKPDLICMTGDYVDGSFKMLAGDMEPLRSLSARDGVFWITGNHEYFIDWELWSSWYRKCGFRFLENECVFPRSGLAVGGVNDHRAGRKYGAAYPDVGKTFVAATNGEFRVLLQHRPKSVHANIEGHRVDLQLSGHTHGGLCPGLKQLIARANEGYVCGLYRVGRGYLHVSPGLGQWAGFPIRLFDPSEITLLVLKSSKRCPPR